MMDSKKHPYCFCKTALGLIRIEEDQYGITSLKFVDEEADPVLENGKGIYLGDAKAQILEYFEGRRKSFDIPLSMKGTEFQKRVWSALRRIPYGETRSYQEIAEMVGNRKAARAVGMANNRNPIAIIVPCHRVIGKNGKLVGYAGGVNKKQYLLEQEAYVISDYKRNGQCWRRDNS